MQKLTHKERKLVELKVQGKKNKDIYREVYNVAPTTSDKVAVVNTSKILAKPHVKEALQLALSKQNITLERALRPIDKGLSATKQNEYTGEITDDIATQLKASDRALRLLGVNSDNVNTSLHLHLHKKSTEYDI